MPLAHHVKLLNAAPRSSVPGPAVKPNAVVRTLILQSTVPGELVVDPFVESWRQIEYFRKVVEDMEDEQSARRENV